MRAKKTEFPALPPQFPTITIIICPWLMDKPLLPREGTHREIRTLSMTADPTHTHTSMVQDVQSEKFEKI